MVLDVLIIQKKQRQDQNKEQVAYKQDFEKILRADKISITIKPHPTKHMQYIQIAHINTGEIIMHMPLYKLLNTTESQEI